MLAIRDSRIQYIGMPEGRPPQPDELRDFYEKIAPIVESPDGYEPQKMVLEWNAKLFGDVRREAEMLMLVHGHAVSDRFLYGFCAAVAGIREENGGELPELTDGQYEMDREVQDSHRAAQDGVAEEYFLALEEAFENRFPLTSTTLSIMEHDLRRRLAAPEAHIQEGFIPGWYKAVKVAMPLFADEEPAG